MDIKKLLEDYIPFNEKEETDKKVFLQALNHAVDPFIRDNLVAHFTSSSFIFNKERTKLLMIYHNIYDSWAWVGGHADGDPDLLHVAIKEAKEETGIKHIKPITDEIFNIDTIIVHGHIKKGKYVSDHIHLNVLYLLEAEENDTLTIKADENSNVAWIEISNLEDYISEIHMIPIYNKILSKAKEKGYLN